MYSHSVQTLCPSKDPCVSMRLTVSQWQPQDIFLHSTLLIPFSLQRIVVHIPEAQQTTQTTPPNNCISHQWGYTWHYIDSPCSRHRSLPLVPACRQPSSWSSRRALMMYSVVGIFDSSADTQGTFLQCADVLLGMFSPNMPCICSFPIWFQCHWWSTGRCRRSTNVNRPTLDSDIRLVLVAVLGLLGNRVLPKKQPSARGSESRRRPCVCGAKYILRTHWWGCRL